MGAARVSSIEEVNPPGIHPVPVADATVTLEGPMITKSDPLGAIELHAAGVLRFNFKCWHAGESRERMAIGSSPTWKFRESGNTSSELHNPSKELPSLPVCAWME